MDVSLDYLRMLFKCVALKITIKLLVLFLCSWEVLVSYSDQESGNLALWFRTFFFSHSRNMLNWYLKLGQRTPKKSFRIPDSQSSNHSLYSPAIGQRCYPRIIKNKLLNLGLYFVRSRRAPRIFHRFVGRGGGGGLSVALYVIYVSYKHKHYLQVLLYTYTKNNFSHLI